MSAPEPQTSDSLSFRCGRPASVASTNRPLRPYANRQSRFPADTHNRWTNHNDNANYSHQTNTDYYDNDTDYDNNTDNIHDNANQQHRNEEVGELVVAVGVAESKVTARAGLRVLRRTCPGRSLFSRCPQTVGSTPNQTRAGSERAQ